MILSDEEIRLLDNLQLNIMMTRYICKLHEGYELVEREEYSILEFDDGNSYTSAIVYDYCEDSSITYPLLVENNISLLFFPDDLVIAAYDDNTVSLSFEDNKKHSLRAAVIVYLKLKGQFEVSENE